MKNNIKEAVEILKAGGIVIFPTDTVYGIGCRIDNESAIKRLFKIRKRPENKAVPVLVSTIDMGKEYVGEIPQDAEKLMKRYWPGALTIILQCVKARVPELVRGKGETLGIRIPDSKVIRQIISEAGVPILGPSANFSGEKTPYRLEDLDGKLVSLVDFVLRGKINGKKMASTVIDCTVEPWKIVRQGAVTID